MINFYFKTCGVSRKWMIEDVKLKLKRVVHWCGIWLMNKNNRFIPNYIDLIKHIIFKGFAQD